MKIDDQLCMRVPSALKKELEEEAKAAGVSMGDLGREILDRGIKDLRWARRRTAPPLAPAAQQGEPTKEGAAA